MSTGAGADTGAAATGSAKGFSANLMGAAAAQSPGRTPPSPEARLLRMRRRRGSLAARLHAGQEHFYRAGETLEVSFQRRCQGVEPVNVADEVLERLAGKNVLDPHRQDGDAMIDGSLDLSANLRRGIRVAEKTRIMIRDCSMASMMHSLHSMPGTTSLGRSNSGLRWTPAWRTPRRR